jgi:hypothetical protein
MNMGLGNTVSKARYPHLVAVFMLCIAVGAGAFAAENSTNLENSLFVGRPDALQGKYILNRLLTWPEKEQQGDGEAKDEEAKEEPLESDRPGFTNSTSTVGFRRLEIESGYKYTQAVGGDTAHNMHDLPELLVRYGLAERLEMRVAWDAGLIFDQFTDRHSGRVINESGSTDMEFGLKYALTKQDKWLPQSAIITSVTAPVGTASHSSEQTDVNVSYQYGWELNDKISLNCGTGILNTADSGDHYLQFSQAVSIDYSITEKLHVFNEWAGFFCHDFSDNRPQHYYDAGLTYLVTPNFQLDWSAGVGLSDAADGFFTGCGFSIRR